jgi:hypothetical protein
LHCLELLVAADNAEEGLSRDSPEFRPSENDSEILRLPQRLCLESK